MLTYISLCDVNIYICESRNYLDYHLNTFLFARLCLRLPLPGSEIFLFFFCASGNVVELESDMGLGNAQGD